MREKTEQISNNAEFTSTEKIRSNALKNKTKKKQNF